MRVFTLRFHALAHVQTSTQEASKQHRVQKRILVVEDMEPVRTTLIRLLKRKNFDVVGAADGLAASEILAEYSASHFDLVITDMMMPRMNGSQLCTLIGEKYPRALRADFIRLQRHARKTTRPHKTPVSGKAYPAGEALWGHR